MIDDCSRAVCGYTVFLGAPSALNLSLALRQAVRPKADPGWVVSGLPDVLYADHGSDFTSDHLRQVCVDLHVRLVHSTVARPQGRGKIERFFGTVTTELLPLLPGHLVRGKPATPPALTLAGLDAAFATWLGGYHQRTHSETGLTPTAGWLADGWLPRTTDTPEQLDLLLVMVAAPRVVHRDGIRFQGVRYLHPTLAAYVGETVTIRYDPLRGIPRKGSYVRPRIMRPARQRATGLQLVGVVGRDESAHNSAAVTEASLGRDGPGKEVDHDGRSEPGSGERPAGWAGGGFR